MLKPDSSLPPVTCTFSSNRLRWKYCGRDFVNTQTDESVLRPIGLYTNDLYRKSFRYHSIRFGILDDNKGIVSSTVKSVGHKRGKKMDTKQDYVP